jgi:hypothetical protein
VATDITQNLDLIKFGINYRSAGYGGAVAAYQPHHEV